MSAVAASLSKPFFVSLGPRGAVRVGGPDRVAFLQAIVSNDLSGLPADGLLYSCLLSPQGKFLHDFFIAADGDTLLLDCEAGPRAADLLAKLKPYKLRSKIELTLEPDRSLYAILPPPEALSPPGRGLGEGDINARSSMDSFAGFTIPFTQPSPQGGEGFQDPRAATLGWRTSTRPHDLAEQPATLWDEARIRLGFPDGSRDMEVGRDTLLDCNIDRAHGLSHTKGCYVGQEITARMNLRGLVKKRLRPISGAALPPPFTDIMLGGQLAGQMRSSSGGIGLALLKDDMLDAMRAPDSPFTLMEDAS